MRKMFECFQRKYNCCFDTLKNISYDKQKKEFLCFCESRRLDFDKFTLTFFKHPLPSSVDTLLFDEIDKILYLVEFKNQKCSQIDNEEIKKKVLDSINSLRVIAQSCNIRIKNYKFFVCIVYSDKDKWKRKICSNTIQFGLEYFKERGIVFDVRTNDIEWFKKKYLSLKTRLL